MVSLVLLLELLKLPPLLQAEASNEVTDRVPLEPRLSSRIRAYRRTLA